MKSTKIDLKKNHNKNSKYIYIYIKKKKKQNIVDYYCNPQCNCVGWTMILLFHKV